MHKKFPLAIGIGGGAMLVVLMVTLVYPETSFNPSLELDFNYQEANSKLQESLDQKGIRMSSPIILNNEQAISQFCSFFVDEDVQNIVEYCTSTELLDNEGNFLGNIHIVGSEKFPKIVLVLVQSDPFMTELPQTKLVFQTVVEDLVCNCWENIQPSEISSIAQWIDKLGEFHTSDTKPSSKSNVSLEGKQLQMEITTNAEGYLWKLLISKS